MSSKGDSIVALRVAGVVCALLALLLYTNTLNCKLTFDDRVAIVENQDLRPKSPWTVLLWHDFWGDDIHHPNSHKSFRPLSVATFKFNYHLHELYPMGYHLANVILNAAVTYLYVQFCGAVFLRVWPALIAGLLFATHPIHTEAVASAVGRAELLSSIFFLVSLECYRKAVHSKKEMRWLALTVFLCLCSLLSKEQGITALTVCFAYDYFIEQKMDFLASLTVLKAIWTQQKGILKPTKAFLKRTTFLAMATISLLILRMCYMRQTPSFGFTDNPAQKLTTPYRQLHILHLCFVNSWLLINPSQLLHDWRLGAVPLMESLTDPRHLLTLTTVVAVMTLGLHGMSKATTQHKIVPLALSFIVFSYLPASNFLFPVGFVVAERVLYIPSMGYCLLLAHAAWHSMKSLRLRHFIKLGLLYLLVVHSTKTLYRNRDWYSNFDLYVSAIKVYPGNGLMYSNMGFELKSMGNNSEAEEMYKVSLQLAPNYSQTYRNYGAMLRETGRHEEAEKLLRTALQILPKKNMKKRSKTIETYQALADAVSHNESRLEEALDIINEAISLKPEVAESHNIKGAFLLKLNRTTEAKASLEHASHLKPEFLDPYHNLGLTYKKEGNRAKAEDYFRKLLSADKRNGKAMMELGISMSTSKDVGKLLEAKKYLETVVNVKANLTEAQYSLALIHQELHNPKQAESALLMVTRLEPSHENALLKLGEVYYSMKSYTAAAEWLTKLTELYPDNTDGIKLLGDCYLKVEEYEKSMSLYELVLERNPIHVETIYSLGLLKEELGLYEDAVKLFSKVLHLDSSHEMARRELAYARALHGSLS